MFGMVVSQEHDIKSMMAQEETIGFLQEILDL
jgi:hypothetical protein